MKRNLLLLMGYTCIGWLRADNHTTANTTSDQE